MLVSTGVGDGMATTNDGVDMSEVCTDCGRDTPHAVSVQIETESSKTENAEFSREPYRVSECQVCGATTSTRMNNA
jgi:rRNA maturation protein Nop10